MLRRGVGDAKAEYVTAGVRLRSLTHTHEFFGRQTFFADLCFCEGGIMPIVVFVQDFCDTPADV